MRKLDSRGATAGSFVGNILKNNMYVYLAFIVPIFLNLFILFCFNAIPFGDTTILRMDLYHQYGPMLSEFYDRLVGGESLIYSWTSGLGGPFLGNFFNYLASPFSLLILIFGHENMPEAISAIIILKGAFASAFFCYYLKRSLGNHSQITAAFGILYSFCGFIIAYYWNIMWLDAMVLFPLVILGIETIIKKHNAVLYVITLALTMISSYYMAYMLCIFSVLYFVAYYFSNMSIVDYCDGIKTYTNKKGKAVHKLRHKFFYSRFVRSGLLFVGGSLLAACIAAVALIPIYFILQSSSAVANKFPSDFNLYYTIFDFLANHIAAVDPTIRSSGENVLPNVYCGVVTVILVPLYLFIKSIPIKEKVVHVGLLGVLFSSFNLNIANYIWHGFHFPNDLPYRFSFMYSFILLIMAYKTITKIKELKGKDILCSGLGVLFFVILVQELGSKNTNNLSVFLTLLFVVFYTIILNAMRNPRLKSGTLAIVMLVCVVSEVICCDSHKYSLSQTKTSYAGDYKDFVSLKSKLDKYEDNNFYRMELTELRTRMDNSWYGYNGVSNFSSMAYSKLANLQSDLGMMSNYINSYTYNLQTPVYNSMMSLKYIVKNDINDRMSEQLYTEKLSSGVFTAFRNKYCLPIAYCVNSDIKEWKHDSGDPFEVQSDYFKKATGVSDVFKRIEVKPETVSYDNIDPFFTGFTSGYFTYNKTVQNAPGSFSLTITPEVTQNCYIFLKSNDVENINIEGSDFYITHNSRSSIIDLGTCNAGQPLNIEISIKDDKKNSGNVTFFAYGLEMNKFIEGYDILEKEKINTTAFDDTYIKGDVIAENDCVLYTSIPYDEGWRVTVDGAAVGPKDIVKIGDALLGINLTAGTHTVEFSFEQHGLLVGGIISCSALALLILLIIITSIKRRKKVKAASKHDCYDIENYVLPDDEPHIRPISDACYNPADFSLDTQKPIDWSPIDSAPTNSAPTNSPPTNSPPTNSPPTNSPPIDSVPTNTSCESIENNLSSLNGNDINTSNDIFVSDSLKNSVKKGIEASEDDDVEITVEKFEGKE